MQGRKISKRNSLKEIIPVGSIRLFMGMALALVILTVLILSMEPGTDRGDKAVLSHALLSERAEVNIDSEDLAARVLEQRFQIHMEEMDQQMGEIPYVEVWVLNDPFYPLIGEVGTLRDEEGTISSKEWQMLEFPDYDELDDATAGGTSGPAAPPSTLPVTTGVPQRVVIVEEIYEIRGIRYARIKVNDNTFDKLKAGSEFAEVFRVTEIKDSETVIVLCGDETYGLKVDQLRKI